MTASRAAAEALAADLRLLKVTAGDPTLRVLERLTAVHGYAVSRATIQRILSGSRLPTWDQLKVIVEACDGTSNEWRARWQRAVLAERVGVSLPKTLAAAAARLDSPEMDERLAGVEVLRSEVAQQHQIPRYAEHRIPLTRAKSDYHWPVVAMLARFIQRRSPAPGDDDDAQAFSANAQAASDVQAAAKAIAYRARVWEPERVDLSHSDLRAIRIPRAWLPRSILANCWLQHAELLFAHMEGADLTAARLEGANLRAAHLQEAILEEAGLGGASLFRADLRGAWLARADLVRARLDKADLTGAHGDGT